jgi:NDP-sugar pyrophosphorylase family protein
VEHAYQPLLDQQRERLAGVIDDGLWFDIGTPQRYIAASRALLDATLAGHLPPAKGSLIEGDSLVHDTARTRAAVRSVIGANSIVEGRVRDSIVWDHCRIAAGVTLERCIVGHGVQLAHGDYHDLLIVAEDPAIPAECERRDGLVVSPV